MSIEKHKWSDGQLTFFSADNKEVCLESTVTNELFDFDRLDAIAIAKHFELILTKKEKLDKLIMKSIGRATTPQTGWAIWQKIKRKTAYQGNDVCERMVGLFNEGKITHAGHDADGDSQYVKLTKEQQ